MADHDVGRDASRLDAAQARKLGRDERGLLELGAGQLLERPVEAELRDIEADRVGRLVVHGARLGERLRHRAAHADVLRALAREAERDLHAAFPFGDHSMNAEPHVMPPPTAVMSTRIPGWSRPDSTASARPIGMDAADVLP